MCNCASVVRWIAVVILSIAVVGFLIAFLLPCWALYEPGLDRVALSTSVNAGPTVSESAASNSSSDAPPAAGKTPGVADGVADVKSASILNQYPAEREGLWARCELVNYTHCIFFWQNGFQLEHSFPAWHKAAQVLYMVGLVILVITLVIAYFNVCCCRCCVESAALPNVLGTFTVIGVLPILASIIVYGAMAYKERGIMLAYNVEAEETTTGGLAIAGREQQQQQQEEAITVGFTTAIFDWGYYLIIASLAVSLLAAALLLCDGKRSARSVLKGDGKGHYQNPNADEEV